MSFARKVKSILEKKSKKADSLLDVIDDQLLKDVPAFSFKEVELLASAVAEEAASGNEEKLRKAFYELFDAYFAPVPRYRGVLSPSKFYGDCSRKLYYELEGVPYSDPLAGRPSPKLQRIFDVGTWWHAYLQNILYKSGCLKASEVRVKSLRYRTVGSADGIVTLSGKDYLLEIKSINSNSFKRLVAPLQKHIEQATIYAHLLKLENIIFLYVDKDTCELLEFIVKVDKKVVETFADTVDSLLSFKDGEVPERTCDNVHEKRALDCKFCTHCFK